MAFFPGVLDRSESDALADKCQAHIVDKGWGVWVVEHANTRTFIGIVGLHVPSADLPFSPCVEVLWRLALPYWGQGYATEAAAAALNVGFECLDLPEIVAFAVADNHRSRAVMERLGMVDSGQNFEHPHLPEHSPLREHCLYKISRQHWMDNIV